MRSPKRRARLPRNRRSRDLRRKWRRDRCDRNAPGHDRPEAGRESSGRREGRGVCEQAGGRSRGRGVASEGAGRCAGQRAGSRRRGVRRRALETRRAGSDVSDQRTTAHGLREASGRFQCGDRQAHCHRNRRRGVLAGASNRHNGNIRRIRRSFAQDGTAGVQPGRNGVRLGGDHECGSKDRRHQQARARGGHDHPRRLAGWCADRSQGGRCDADDRENPPSRSVRSSGSSTRSPFRRISSRSTPGSRPLGRATPAGALRSSPRKSARWRKGRPTRRARSGG